MAIFHARMQVIGRSSGRSAVAAAAYRAAERLHDEQLHREHDFTAKAGVVHSEIMLPEGAPERWRDRATLWNEVEATEKRRDAQLAREMEFSIARELSQAEAIRLARDFVVEQFVSRGMVADVAVHWATAKDGEAQPHAHVMLTMRGVGPDGFGPKARAWNSRALYEGIRERWAGLANERLCEQGHDVRIDHRSYAEQGIGLEPQGKIGPAGARRADRGEDAERAAEHDAIARRNGERIAADPSVALDALTRQHSTFTRHELARLVNRHTDGAEQFASVLAVVEASPELVRLGVDGRGRERFTTREMLGIEQRMEQAAAALSERKTHPVALERRQAAMSAAELGEEQRLAVGHVTRARDLAVVVGYAGTGKSTMLGVARAAWEAEGYRVRGAALSGIAAEGLEAGSGIASRTLASLEWGWREGREADRLGSRDVLVVDEAGMVGSRQMERVLSAAREAGAKVVLVGDPEQLQAIEAGAAFRALVERHGAVEIGEVRRQRAGWQREATRELATGGTQKALERYEQAGMVVGAETREAAYTALVAAWDAERRAAPAQSRVILATTRADVAALNALARARLRAAGELGEEHQVVTERGLRAFAAGDRVMFLRNERGLGVKNGTLGTVEGIEAGGRFTVRLDAVGAGAAGADGSARRVGFDVSEYGHVEHGYAATIHKAQGVTVERAHVLASGLMDRHAAYVALTRHRDGVALHYGRDEFADGAQLARALGRERLKDTSLDYAGPGGAGPGERGPGGAEREGAELAGTAAAYAERRGLDPLRPSSEIVVRQGPAPRRSLRERLAGLRAGMGEAGGVADPLAQARAYAERLREEARAAETVSRLVPGSLEWAAAGFRRAWGEVADYRARFGRALPEQERALERAEVLLEQALPRGAEVLGEALAAGRAGPGRVGMGQAGAEQGVELAGLRRAAAARERAHREVAAYRVADDTAQRALAALERDWQGSERQRERHASLAERRWTLACAAVAEPERAGVLERVAPALAEHARGLAAAPGDTVQVAARERVRQLEAEQDAQRQAQAPRQGRGRGMSMGM